MPFASVFTTHIISFLSGCAGPIKTLTVFFFCLFVFYVSDLRTSYVIRWGEVCVFCLYFCLFSREKEKKQPPHQSGVASLIWSPHPLLFFFLLAPETQGARQTQTKTQEVHGHVALPRPAEHHGAGQGEGALLLFHERPALVSPCSKNSGEKIVIVKPNVQVSLHCSFKGPVCETMTAASI